MTEKINEQILIAEVSAETKTASAAPLRKIMKIRPTLTDMEVGDEVRFPVIQMKSVRTQASELGVILERRYQTKVDKEARIIKVTRTA